MLHQYVSPGNKIIDLVASLQLPFANVRRGEEVMIVTDTNMDPLICQAVMAVLPQADGFQQAPRPGLFFLRADARHRHGHFHVLLRCQVRDQIAGHLLPHEAHPGAAIVIQIAIGQLEQVLPIDRDPARRRAIQSAQHVEQRRFARSRCADDADQLAALDRQIESLQGDDFDVGHLVDFDQVLANDEG